VIRVAVDGIPGASGPRTAGERLAPLGLDPDSVAEVEARWLELQEPVAEIRRRAPVHEVGPLAFVAWLRISTLDREDR
jgi:hypothetical protein